MQHGMTRPISRTSSPIRLASFPIIQTLSSKRPLIDPSIVRPRKRHPIPLELVNRRRGLPRHIMDSILVSEPVGALDSVVHMPSVVVFGDVPQCGIDSALRGDCVRAGWELAFLCVSLVRGLLLLTCVWFALKRVFTTN